jgi:branched-chain amino acid transport system permease protein
MADDFKVSYREDMALFQNLWIKVWFWILLFLILISPLFLSRYQLSIFIEIGIAVIGAVGLGLLSGYAGQISIGHGAFVAIGAYTSALITGKLGVPFIISLPLSGLFAAAIGMVVGIPSLRLKGLYLALATLAFHLIVEYILFHWDLTQGDMGMAVKEASIGGFPFNTETRYVYLTMVITGLAILVAKNIVRSKFGRNFMAIRDRDMAAEALGIKLTKYKVIAFGISAFYGGIAGCLTAHYQKYIIPGSFDLFLSLAFIAMIVIGGVGSILGCVFGAILITGIPHILVYIIDIVKEIYPGAGMFIMDIKAGIFGLIIVFILLFQPEGLFGIYQRTKIYWKTWPFKF